tara:strand:+ start:372 stop:527 length:156 start_codon:yes stop_codon:yes gene_type:complete
MKIENISKDIADFVSDHKKHFDAYPVEVEVGERVYSYEEYWQILDSSDINK